VGERAAKAAPRKREEMGAESSRAADRRGWRLYAQILYKTIGSVFAEQNTCKALSLASDFLGRPLIIFISLDFHQSSKGTSTPPTEEGIFSGMSGHSAIIRENGRPPAGHFPGL
jgi:hypothetical protein